MDGLLVVEASRDGDATNIAVGDSRPVNPGFEGEITNSSPCAPTTRPAARPAIAA
jgi:hypothetical protein